MTYIQSPNITDWQKQIIYGTVLGGSSIVKQKNGRNCYLAMRGKNKDWIECKARELSVLQSPNPYYAKNGYFRWHSSCSPALNGFYDIFYDNGKIKVEMELLNQLRDIALGIWFVDAGVIKDNFVYLYTFRLGVDGTEIINQYFKEIDLNNSIVKDKNRFKIKFDLESSKQFIALISYTRYIIPIGLWIK